MKNHLINDLIDLGISESESFEIFHPKTRDLDSINVLKCKKSGVIVLDQILRNKQYYIEAEKKGYTYLSDGLIKPKHLEDDLRRFESYKGYSKNSDVLDFGCGNGEFLSLIEKNSKSSIGIELNQDNANFVNNMGIKCFSNLDNLPSNYSFDLITLNHVFEHLPDPIETLSNLIKHLKDDGTLIIEVPHARDLLIEAFNLEAFKDFTFWSEHLILHTKESLNAFATKSGLKLKKIQGFQRYPISNHFNWLLNNKQGGHEIFSDLNNSNFHNEYEKYLQNLNLNDTLIGFFCKDLD